MPVKVKQINEYLFSDTVQIQKNKTTWSRNETDIMWRLTKIGDQLKTEDT